MDRTRRRASATAAGVVAVVVASGVATARAQEIEPRAYSNAPIGVNFLIAGYAYTRGGVPTDGSLPIEDPRLHTSNMVVGFAHAFDLWGMSAKVDAVAPYTWLSGSADYHGESLQRIVNGFSDPSFRLSVNLYGAPALSLPEFASYRQDLIIGASLRVFAPWGQYDGSRLVNIGTHRWAIKPEIGISKAIDAWTLEFTAGATLYTDNNDFYGGNTRSQDPLYSFQGHAIYSFPNGIWGSIDATYFAGGRSTLNGTLSADLQQNWRLGATLALPVDRYNSVKLYASSGVSARTGNSYDLLGIAWQHRWGGGL